jgi:hypothetical protein
MFDWDMIFEPRIGIGLFAVDGLRRSHATPAQRGHESDGLPVALRHMPHQPPEGAATEKPARKRRERKPSLAGALKQASKAGAKVRGATMAADGSVSLQFGEPQTEQTNDLDKWMAKHHAN